MPAASSYGGRPGAARASAAAARPPPAATTPWGGCGRRGWLTAAARGLWTGRLREPSRGSGGLLANAGHSPTLPEMEPGRTVVNRLWPLIIVTAAAAAIAFLLPQVPAIGAGYALLVALSWRKQARAVAAIEGRDGVRFYVERTSPLSPMQL